MADITNAEAIRFVNEQIRPLAESYRGLKARTDAALVTWFGGLNSVVTNSASDPVVDGREAEGVSRLSGADVVNFVTQLTAFQAALNASGVPGVISKPCVRALIVQD
jgi:hypothetical protein